ncbi:ketopantoate reductase family protein [Solirubrobacter sp. CPCC 204708]|uniref:2-dehydropantoate 2-reductase n=1 Tax=Solirubrobacter deserti TaxID=2282478 RepID=A0ABT4RI08_9ACTN|nr:2-dehydropantoate 2-reductase [Solirubrobacter deserti]MBE2318808.1 ketopantoate reductase family protein [Solirubrobacter deserti]MDA0138188.1 2-dehydropantoate 2-reductase [Solirubrobacter deserti]
MPRILVVGGGAIGGITAAGAAADVVVLDANEVHAAKLNDPGLVINGADPQPLRAVTTIQALEGEFDFALIAVKSPLHATVIPPLVERGGIGAFVTLGNGLIQDRVEAIVGKGNLLACLVEWGGSNVGPGELVRDSEGGYVVGELDGAITDRARALAEALQPLGHTRVTDNVRGMIWTKLQVNSTFTGLSAISGLRYGGVAEQGPDAVFALWEEGVRVARAQGLELGEMHGVHAYEFSPEGLARMMEHMANVRPSMLQDLDAGRETEVDVVNGGVAAKGRELNLPTPCNDKVVELVHSMERGERAPSPDYLAYVSAAQITSAADS